MKTSVLQGHALDWAVAKCEGITFEGKRWFYPDAIQSCVPLNYRQWSTDWAQGGLIIEREGICLQFKQHNKEWHATIDIRNRKYQSGQYLFVRWHPSSPLIAAMRCYVASKLGDEVEIPEELI